MIILLVCTSARLDNVHADVVSLSPAGRGGSQLLKDSDMCDVLPAHAAFMYYGSAVDLWCIIILILLVLRQAAPAELQALPRLFADRDAAIKSGMCVGSCRYEVSI